MLAAKPKVIVGLGKTGYACARYFAAKDIPFIVMDNATQPACLIAFKKAFSDINITPIELELLLQANEAIVSPGVPLALAPLQKALEAGVTLTSDVAMFARLTQKPLIIITGSNGKSTVTSLVGKILSQAGYQVGIGGNIGTPCLDLLSANYDIHVLEISSYQLELTPPLGADVAVVLNLSPDHMDRYSTQDDYYRTKAKIYQNCRVAICNRSVDFVFDIPSTAKRMTFGLDKPPQSEDFGVIRQGKTTYLSRGDHHLLAVNELKVNGRHNWANILAAFTISVAMGVDQETMVAVARTYVGLRHRCQWLGEFDGVSYINDSKATNPGATLAAIQGLADEHKSIILILGGKAKGLDFSCLNSALSQHAKEVFAFGQDRGSIAAQLALPIQQYPTLSEVINAHTKILKTGDLVLFSPGCASLDQFDNFEHRGTEFERLVQGFYS